MIALLVMTDGRADCIARTIESATANLDPTSAISELWIHDDSTDPAYRAWLRERFWTFNIIGPPDGAGRSGFGGAIRSAWSTLSGRSRADFVFHLEDDFTFRRPVPIRAMAAVLDRQPHLVQLALRRQPWNAEEAAAGGIVEQHPDDYTECLEHWPDGPTWLEHRRFFTTNPSLYRRSLILDHDWPEGVNSEGRFGIGLLAEHPDWRFGFWGSRDSGEAVEHIGHVRAGVGY